MGSRGVVVDRVIGPCGVFITGCPVKVVEVLTIPVNVCPITGAGKLPTGCAGSGEVAVGRLSPVIRTVNCCPL